MTPTQLEHLKRIDAHLERLLNIASKRTLGKWRAESSRAYCADESVTHNVVGPPSDFMYLQELPDAIYIAACAGNAEAGWRATRAVIQWFLKWDNSTDYSHLVDPILAAFPIETLETLK